MDLLKMIEAAKKHPEADRIGMILCHNGVVRGTSRDGRDVSGLRITVDHDKLKAVIAKNKQQPGIVDILVEIAEDRDLAVGDDVMFLVVAGDIREHVIAALTDTLNAVKSSVTNKTQFFI
jgi:molybdopterin synthase catalytic subunit